MDDPVNHAGRGRATLEVLQGYLHEYEKERVSLQARVEELEGAIRFATHMGAVVDTEDPRETVRNAIDYVGNHEYNAALDFSMVMIRSGKAAIEEKLPHMQAMIVKGMLDIMRIGLTKAKRPVNPRRKSAPPAIGPSSNSA